MKYLIAAQLDDLADQAEAFQMVLLDAYDAAGHGWAPETGWTDDGLPIREDKTCVLCGEPMPCPAAGKIIEAGRAARSALIALGAWEEVLSDADARHGPSLKGCDP